MGNHIPVIDSSEADNIQVRRRNTQGAQTVALSITVPKTLNKELEALMAEGQSKSLIATELMLEALEARKG